MNALEVYAGPKALAHLQAQGLRPQDVRLVPGAAGGPKGLILNPLDRFLFGQWLAATDHPVHLLGASIGAWRMACACTADPDAAFARMADDYIRQKYDHRPGKPPTPSHVSAVFGEALVHTFGGLEPRMLAHPRYRLHVFTSRGRHRLLRRQGRVRTPLGYLGAFCANSLSRRAMGGWIERVIFSDAREPLPLQLQDYRTRVVPLDAHNLCRSILASCSIPFWLDAVHDIPGAPQGAYWDGGITDYHLHLDYASMGEGLVLYPHFQASVIPGWLDKAFKRRHRATAHLDNVVVLAPSAEWVRTLPGGKLPDRSDFKRYGDDVAARVAVWQQAVRESGRLRDEFAEWVGGSRRIEVRPLA